MNQNITSWEEIKLAKVGKIITGKTPPTNQTKYYNGEYPFVTPTDMNDNRHIITERYLSDKAAKRYPNYLLPKNSVCFTCIGATIGKMCKTNSKSFTNQQINSVVVNRHYDSDFIYYLLKTYKENIVNLAAGAATPIVNKTLFSNIEILVPKLPIQRTIGLYLAAFDDLIENNQTRIGLLEEMAQLLYREWFVEFRFPGYENHKFVNSELGKIPERWVVKKATDLMKFIKGFEPGSLNYNEDCDRQGLIPFYRVSDLDVSGNSTYCINESLNGIKLCEPENVLISMDATLGRVATGLNGAYSSGIRKVVPIVDDIEYSFIYFWLKSEYVQNTIVTYAKGATILHAGGSIRYLKLPYSNDVYKQFIQQVNPVYRLILNLIKQNRNLIEQRGLLLPKLMSGEIDVSKLDINITKN